MKVRGLLVSLALMIVVAGCVPTTATQGATAIAIPAESPTPCTLPAVVVPTPPAEIPGYAELDPTTGLHVTGTMQEIDLDTYRLEVTGKVDHPLSLTFDDLRCMPKIEMRCTLTCPGFFEDRAAWAGTSIRDVLALAGVQEGASGLKLVGADGYSRLVSLHTARSETSFLAYEWEGEPLPILHGFPVRAVFPESSGGSWVKWLVEIEVL